MRRRLAAIDVGSNTVHLLVADVEHGVPEDVHHQVALRRLGSVVGRTGGVGPEALAEVVADIESMAQAARHHHAEMLLCGATEAVRRAADRDTVLAALGEAAGTPCRLIPAEVEARLTFRGAEAAHPGRGLHLVADVGGGSTECVLGERGTVQALASVPIGSGAATDRWLRSDPPTADELGACAEGVRAALAGVPEGRPARGSVAGGTATTLPLLLGRDEGGGRLDRHDLDECRARLQAAPSRRIAERHGIDPVRARVLPGGVEIIAAVVARYGLDAVHVSSRGVRDGMILAYAEKGDGWISG